MASRPRDYRAHVALRQRPRLNLDKLRTVRKPGDLEIVVDPKTGKERAHRFDEGIAA